MASAIVQIEKLEEIRKYFEWVDKADLYAIRWMIDGEVIQFWKTFLDDYRFTGLSNRSLFEVFDIQLGKEIKPVSAYQKSWLDPDLIHLSSKLWVYGADGKMWVNLSYPNPDDGSLTNIKAPKNVVGVVRSGEKWHWVIAKNGYEPLRNSSSNSSPS